jgi:hypothetical protein
MKSSIYTTSYPEGQERHKMMGKIYPREYVNSHAPQLSAYRYHNQVSNESFRKRNPLIENCKSEPGQLLSSL